MNRVLYLTIACVCCFAFSSCEPTQTASTPPAADGTAAIESTKAQVGVGIKGRSLDNETGVGKIVSAPVSAFFAVKERVAFDILVPQALSLFRATEGRCPKSHEEFMEKIIKPNRIELPALPPGAAYRFNPELCELWVDPVNPPADQTPAASNGPSLGNP